MAEDEFGFNVWAEYERRCQDGASDIADHLPTILQQVVDIGAQTIVELGTRGGNSTTALLAGAELTEGHVWAVDLNKAPFQTWRLSFIVGNDLDHVVQGLVPDPIDLLLIDTSHHYGHTLMELDLYGTRVRPGGRVILHDTELEHPAHAPNHEPPFPVREAMVEWALDLGYSWTEYAGSWGLGVVYVGNEGEDVATLEIDHREETSSESHQLPLPGLP